MPEERHFTDNQMAFISGSDISFSVVVEVFPAVVNARLVPQPFHDYSIFIVDPLIFISIWPNGSYGIGNIIGIDVHLKRLITVTFY